MHVVLNPDVSWLLDKYVRVINSKLRAQKLEITAKTKLASAIITKFLVEHQKEILDEYKLLEGERLLTKLDAE